MTSRCPGAMLLYIRLRESVTCVNREWEEGGGAVTCRLGCCVREVTTVIYLWANCRTYTGIPRYTRSHFTRFRYNAI